MTPLRTFRSAFRTLALSAVLAGSAALATVPAGAQGTAPTPRPGEPAEGERLPGRTPREAIAGFLDATSSHDYARAAQYLDLHRIPRAERAEQGPILAEQLRVVIDQAFPIDPDDVSDERAGSPQEGVPAGREVIGTAETRTGAVPLVLQRMAGPEESRTWKVAASTVAQIPRLYRELGYGPLAGYLPPALFEIRFFQLALWQWLALLLLVVVASTIGWLGTIVLLRLVAPVVCRAAPVLGERFLAAVVGPLRLGVSVAVFFLGRGLLNLSIPAQHVFREAEKAAVILVLAWAILRLIDVLADLATERLREVGRFSATAVVPLGRKTSKVVIVVLALLAVLQNLGLNVTGLLAGLGIGGLAVALAAQKTVENLFGGITVILDQPVRVGDFCRFGDRIGTVEEIGLRSTRIRTLDRTIVSVPNGHFASLELENYTVRDRMWLHPTISVRYETTPDQLRHLLVEVRRMLYAHPRVDPASARIRFVNFGAYSLDLEIFAYVMTPNYDEFLAVREDIYLRIMDLVEQSGTRFAVPAQTTYLARDAGLDMARREAAESQVDAWRRQDGLLLPDFPPEVVSRLRGTIDYPPHGSAQRGAQGA